MLTSRAVTVVRCRVRVLERSVIWFHIGQVILFLLYTCIPFGHTLSIGKTAFKVFGVMCSRVGPQTFRTQLQADEFFPISV